MNFFVTSARVKRERKKERERERERERDSSFPFYFIIFPQTGHGNPDAVLFLLVSFSVRV